MFEQAFKNIDDVLWKEAGCTTELDYTEQTSWLLFLKYLDGLEQDRADEAALEGKKYTYILDKPYRWETWAAPKGRDGKLDHNTALTGDDLRDFVNQKLFPYLHGFKLKASGGKRGSHAELGAGLDFRPALRDTLRVGATVGWANAEYMQTYFGIDATQAANSGLPAYQAAGGLHNYALITSWTHVFDRHWLGSVALSQRHVAGSARNSPLVTDTSANVASVVGLYLF